MGIHWCTQNAICLHFLPYLLNICRKCESLVSQGSVATCLRWGGYCHMDFVANCMRFYAVQKWKSVKLSQNYRQFNGGNFLRRSVVLRCGLKKTTSVYENIIDQLWPLNRNSKWKDLPYITLNICSRSCKVIEAFEGQNSKRGEL